MYSVFFYFLIPDLFTMLMLITMIISNLIGQFLLHWAFSIVILCISIFSKMLITSLVVRVALGLNNVGMIVGALDSLVDKINISKYLLMNTIVNIKDFNNINYVVHVASVAIVFILFFSFIAVRYKMIEDLR